MDSIKKIAVVVPSHKQELTDLFLKNWKELLDKHKVEFILVDDSDDIPVIRYSDETTAVFKELQSDLVTNKCAGVRQFGFLFVAQRLPNVEYILTFDTDTSPIGDPIQDHINQLNRKVPISWLSTAHDVYLRGFPYGVRKEAPVMLSHGVWDGVPDYDAPTQLLIPEDFKPTYYKGVIPKGIFFPMCGMNLAFRREALPYIYFAPVGQFKGAERWDDIIAGVPIVKDFARLNWGIVSGYARVNHLRASNVFTSLAKEAVGIRHGEEFWKDPENYVGDLFFEDFRDKRKQWHNIISTT